MRRHLAILACMLLAAAAVAAPVDSLRDSILHVITGAPVASARATIDVTRLGARPDGRHDCLKAFNRAIARASATPGGARVIVPAGRYLVRGPINLRSNVCLHLDSAAVIIFDPDPALYPVVESSWEGTFVHNLSPMIRACDVENVAITGRGTIDGKAASTFATWRPHQARARSLSRHMNHTRVPLADRRFTAADSLRPQLIQFFRCRGVTVSGIRITNSPFWCLHLLQSRNIIVRSLRYDAKLINNDGIDPESSADILIEDIDFDNGDDNIAIKSGRDHDGRLLSGPSENIIIRRCRFKGLHAVVIGSEMSGGVRNVIVEDCTYAGYCKRGIYVKTNPERGGFVSNLWVRNCTFDEVEDLFFITSAYAGEGSGATHYSAISDIHVDSLTARKCRAAAIVIHGTEAKPVERVTMSRVNVGSAVTGLSIDNAVDVTLADCNIGPRPGAPSLAAHTDSIFAR